MGNLKAAIGNRGTATGNRDTAIGNRASPFKTVSAVAVSFVVCGDSTEYALNWETPGRVVC